MNRRLPNQYLWRRVAILAVVAATFCVPSAASAGTVSTDLGAVPVRCGDRISVSTTLHRNLDCRGQSGLTIAASNITLDLGGFTLRGDNGIGIVNDTTVPLPLDNMTIRNGKIDGFPGAVNFVESGDLRLLNLEMAGGLYYAGPFTGDGSARLVMSGGSASTVELFMAQADISGARLGPVRFPQADATISDSTIRGDVYSNESNAVLRHVTFVDALVRIGVTSSYVIQASRFRGTHSGVTFVEVVHNVRILDNTFAGSRIGVDTGLGALDQFDGTVISGNLFTHNLLAGVLLEAGTAQTGTPLRITGNIFIHNGYGTEVLTDISGSRIDDGLHLNLPANPTMLVAGNTAIHNADLGIEAPPVDDGGIPNYAAKNGDLRQCTGVTCIP